MIKEQVQTALRVLFPPSCSGCGGHVDSEFGLCSTCFRDVSIISGPVCKKCGQPIMADPTGSVDDICEDCLKIARPWQNGRAAVRYSGIGRKLVLSLKHGDRQDVAILASSWLARAATPLLQEDTVVVPIPLHWTRLLKRKFNQSALLAQHMALKAKVPIVVDGLVRTRKTAPMDGANVKERFSRLEGCMKVSPKRMEKLRGKSILLIDDVMTSGATFAAACEALNAAQPRRVDVLALARVGKDD